MARRLLVGQAWQYCTMLRRLVLISNSMTDVSTSNTWNSDRENTNQILIYLDIRKLEKVGGRKETLWERLSFSLPVVFWKIPTRTAFLAAHMMRFPSAVQVLHLTRTSSSFSASWSLTLIVFHSLADDAWNSCNDAKNKQVVEDVSKITSACSGVKRASLQTVVSNCRHLDCTVVGRCGHNGVIGGETAVIYWLKVAKHGVLRWRLVEVPQLQTEHKEWVQKGWWFKMLKHMHNLNVHALVIGAGDQQEAPHRVGELAVVDLLFMLLLEDPQEPSSLHIPNLRCRESGACLYLAATGSFHWGEGILPSLFCR